MTRDALAPGRGGSGLTSIACLHTAWSASVPESVQCLLQRPAVCRLPSAEASLLCRVHPAQRLPNTTQELFVAVQASPATAHCRRLHYCVSESLTPWIGSSRTLPATLVPSAGPKPLPCPVPIPPSGVCPHPIGPRSLVHCFTCTKVSSLTFERCD